ncbi:MAG: tetratricopeptide repeat-containing protein [Proteobacteria bacterium]|nr:tetratricopeptide repeat-containing protein [Pseudomonadota bacterium]
MTSVPALAPDMEAPEILGLSTLAHLVYSGSDQGPLRNLMSERLSADPTDAGVLMDASMLLQLTGQGEAGLQVQASALEFRRIYKRLYAQANGLRLLVIMVAGDFMANTPFDFLLEGSDIQAHLVYADPEGRLPETVPDHDVAFVAVGESEPNLPVLQGLKAALADWPRPVFNADVAAIAALTRDGVSSAFADCASVVAPPTARIDRSGLARLAAGDLQLSAVFGSAVDWPVIVRPIDSHAGGGLVKIDRAAELSAYLEAQGEPEFFLSPFVDYASPDGQFRKARVAFIDGKPFISHLAISPHWMVHYLSAGMAESPEKRAEEAEFMAGFDAGFAARQAEAVKALTSRIGLDYFAIDCAELADGRLLLFEADVAMIVHDLDDSVRFAYKKPAMRKLFDAFQAALGRRMGDGAGRGAQSAA